MKFKTQHQYITKNGSVVYVLDKYDSDRLFRMLSIENKNDRWFGQIIIGGHNVKNCRGCGGGCLGLGVFIFNKRTGIYEISSANIFKNNTYNAEDLHGIDLVDAYPYSHKK